MTRPSEPRPDAASMLRVNQAGEYGATRIYAGQLAVLLPEWLELSVGLPAIMIAFGAVLWWRGFSAELTPDGRDTWVFDMRLTLGLSDGTQRSYFWSQLRLDEGSPERIVALVSGRLP